MPTADRRTRLSARLSAHLSAHLSARARILGWILSTVAVALAVLVIVTGRAVLAGVDAQANRELTHETEKFRTFAAQPDPATAGSFFTVEQLLTSYLHHSVPEHTETFFSIVDRAPDRRSPGDVAARLDRDTAFVERAAGSADPVWGTVDTTAGPARYAVLPVRVSGDASTGQLVIVEFLAPAAAAAWSVIWTMVLVGVIALLLAGLVGWFVSGRVLAPIRAVRETAERIGETDLGRRIEVTGSDDVARLAQTFNSMLDRLEDAFDGQRRFLDDAGHELRTPITVIRGHLDVMGDDPRDHEETIHLVKDELRRMSRLVDDLIMLARSQRPGFLLLAPTDLTELVVETFTKATALAPRRWGIDATPETDALVDGQRLAQALLQLASNAVAHTGPEDSIAMGGRASGDRLLLWVRDSGSGIRLEDRQRIFERFARGADEGREHGTGLGLAIVSRIAHAHGGSVRVESEVGHGAAFTLDLPWRRTGEDTA